MNNVSDTLVDRGVNYGKFEYQAQVAQGIKRAMGSHPGWQRLADDQKEALEMIANKMGRIINGNPNFIDSWHDISGYAKLVDDRLQGIDSNRKSNMADNVVAPAVKTWQGRPVLEEDVDLHQYTLSFGGTD